MVKLIRSTEKESEDQNYCGHVFTIHGELYIFAQVESMNGMFISLEDGNRYTDKKFDTKTTLQKIIREIQSAYVEEIPIEYIGECDIDVFQKS